LICVKVELMSKGSDSAPPLMALLFSAKALVEYKANFVRDFELVDLCLGEGSFYYCFRVHGLRLVKNLTPLWVSPMRKRLWTSESKLATLCSIMKARL
jgi:hypothetical protein